MRVGGRRDKGAGTKIAKDGFGRSSGGTACGNLRFRLSDGDANGSVPSKDVAVTGPKT